MQQPPFRLASTSDSLRAAGPSPYRVAAAAECCAEAPAAAGPKVSARARLGELDAHIHCSVIGTCLTTAELRKLLPRFADIDGARASDLDIHHTAVQFAGSHGPCAKALHKALDERHAATVRRFHAATGPELLADLWTQAMKSGEVPGAYWALMTHRHATPALRQQAFGEVHMLSHLVGAANRADIRRLVALEQENGELKEHAERQQQRLNQMGAQTAALRRQVAAAGAQATLAGAAAQADETEGARQVTSLQQAVEAKDRRVALQTARRQEAERELLQQRETERDLRGQLERQQSLALALQAEVAAMEATLPGPAGAGGDGDAPVARQAGLQGRRVVYVGGRPSSAPSIKAVVEAAGGEIVIHDGGVEDRKGLLAAALPRADAVVFPVDCIDHDSMSTLKKICQRHGVAFYPLRNASVASFLACVAQWGIGAAGEGGQPVSRFCVRHG